MVEDRKNGQGKEEHRTLVCMPLKPVFTRHSRGLPHFMDEPVNGLDFQSTEYLYQQINSYRQYGTILFSSHILESICLTSDRVLVLEQGQIKRSFMGQEIEADKIREVLKE